MKDARFAVGAMLLITATLIPAAAAGQTAEAPYAEIAFGTGVDREARALEGEAVVFGPDHGTIFCLTRVIGMTPPATVTHAWYYEGKTLVRVDLKVGSPNWRTWSSKRYLPSWTGQWEVKALDETGRVLASAGFEIRDDTPEEASDRDRDDTREQE